MNEEATTLEDLLPDEGVLGEQTQTATQPAQEVNLAELEARIRADERARIANESYQAPDDEDDSDLVTKADLRAITERVRADALKEVEAFLAPTIQQHALETLAVGVDAEGRKALEAKLRNLDVATIKAIVQNVELRELYQGFAQSRSQPRVQPPASERLNAQTARTWGVSEADATQLGVLKAMFPNLEDNTLVGYVKS